MVLRPIAAHAADWSVGPNVRTYLAVLIGTVACVCCRARPGSGARRAPLLSAQELGAVVLDFGFVAQRGNPLLLDLLALLF